MKSYPQNLWIKKLSTLKRGRFSAETVTHIYTCICLYKKTTYIYFPFSVDNGNNSVLPNSLKINPFIHKDQLVIKKMDWNTSIPHKERDMKMNALYDKKGHFSPSKQRDFLKRIDPQLVMHEEMEAALSTVSDYITHFVTHLKSGSGMIWMGRQKTAKSILAIYLAYALMEAGFSFRQELNLDFLSTLSQSSEVLEDSYPYAEHSQLLLIDNGGQFAFSLTDKQKHALKHIMDIRRRKALPLIWMTQFSQESLPRFLGEEIAQDLLHPPNRIVHFDWDHSYTLTEKTSCWF